MPLRADAHWDQRASAADHRVETCEIRFVAPNRYGDLARSNSRVGSAMTWQRRQQGNRSAGILDLCDSEVCRDRLYCRSAKASFGWRYQRRWLREQTG
jgi:hypothetical protein